MLDVLSLSYYYLSLHLDFCRLLLQTSSMYEKLAKGTLRPTPCYYVSMLWGFFPTFLQISSMYEKLDQGTLRPTPCYYVSMLWVFCQPFLQAPSMYEKLAQGTLHPIPHATEYALGFLPIIPASFVGVRKARPGYFTLYLKLLSEYAQSATRFYARKTSETILQF